MRVINISKPIDPLIIAAKIAEMREEYIGDFEYYFGRTPRHEIDIEINIINAQPAPAASEGGE